MSSNARKFFSEDPEDLEDEDTTATDEQEEPEIPEPPAPKAKAKPKPKAKAAKKEEPGTMFIVDGAAVREQRIHEMIVDGDIVSYGFQPGTPTEVPYAVGVRFLAIPSFYRTDEQGSRLTWRPAPKQPDEYQPGEQFKLAEDEVVARYDELSGEALRMRAMMLPGGERFAGPSTRDEMIQFIVERKKATRRANSQADTRTVEGGIEEWTPDAGFFDDEVM